MPKCLQEFLLRDSKRAFSLAHPSVSACASVSTGLKVCIASSTEAEEAMEKKEKSVPSVKHPLVLPSPFSWFILERKNSSVSAFMVHTKNVRILMSPLSWFTQERKDSSVSVFMVHTRA